MSQRIRIFFLLTVSLTAFAQEDSLQKVLTQLPAGRQKVEVLNRLGGLYRDRENHLVMAFSQQALKMADSIGYVAGKALSQENMGWALYRMGDYSQSLAYSLEALKLNESLPDSAAIARCLNNVGAIGFEDENYTDAIKNFKRALAIARKLSNRLIGGRSLNNLSLGFYRIHDLDSAEYYARQALLFSHDQPYLKSFANRMLGDLAVARKNAQAAFDYFDQSLALARSIGNTFMETSVMVRKGNLLLSTKRYVEAEVIFNQTAAMSAKAGYKNELENSFNGLSKLFELRGDYTHAFLYKSKYAELHDSLRVESHRERLAYLQYQYASEIQKTNVQLLTKQKALDAQTIRNQRLVMAAGGGGILVLLFGFLFVIRANRRKTTANLELANRAEKINKQAEELRALNHSKDKLFQLLSHDLRGPVGNVKSVFDLLTAGHISQEEFQKLSGVLRPALDNLYLDLNNLLSWSKSQLSGIQIKQELFNVSPLVEELAARARQMAHEKEVTILTEQTGYIPVLADRDQLTSILRNLLSNALKFCNDRGCIHITTSQKNGNTCITVKDDGVGLTPEEVDKIKNHLFFTKPGTHRETGTGIGLILINEFLKANKGQLEIMSNPGQGSAFTVILPSRT